jgi:hypothetical protein
VHRSGDIARNRIIHIKNKPGLPEARVEINSCPWRRSFKPPINRHNHCETSNDERRCDMSCIEDLKGENLRRFQEDRLLELKKALMHRYDIRPSDAVSLILEIDGLARKYQEPTPTGGAT